MEMSGVTYIEHLKTSLIGGLEHVSRMRSKGFPFHSGSKRNVALFRMGGLAVARPDMLSLLKLKVSLCLKMHNTFASFSAVKSHFSQAQHFGDLHRHCAWQAWDIVIVFYGRSSIWCSSIVCNVISSGSRGI